MDKYEIYNKAITQKLLDLDFSLMSCSDSFAWRYLMRQELFDFYSRNKIVTDSDLLNLCEYKRYNSDQMLFLRSVLIEIGLFN